MNLQTAISYTKQYRRHGKSCYIHSSNRYNHSFLTPLGLIEFVCVKCVYHHGGKNKWWRVYLRFQNGKAVPTKMFNALEPNN
jgi:hypothetical protein